MKAGHSTFEMWCLDFLFFLVSGMKKVVYNLFNFVHFFLILAIYYFSIPLGNYSILRLCAWVLAIIIITWMWKWFFKVLSLKGFALFNIVRKNHVRGFRCLYDLSHCKFDLWEHEIVLLQIGSPGTVWCHHSLLWFKFLPLEMLCLKTEICNMQPCKTIYLKFP